MAKAALARLGFQIPSIISQGRIVGELLLGDPHGLQQLRIIHPHDDVLDVLLGKVDRCIACPVAR